LRPRKIGGVWRGERKSNEFRTGYSTVRDIKKRLFQRTRAERKVRKGLLPHKWGRDSRAQKKG